MPEHKVGILTEFATVEDYATYRGCCSCGWTGTAGRDWAVAEVRAAQHRMYHAEAARITARPDGATGTTLGPEARSDD